MGRRTASLRLGTAATEEYPSSTCSRSWKSSVNLFSILCQASMAREERVDVKGQFTSFRMIEKSLEDGEAGIRKGQGCPR